MPETTSTPPKGGTMRRKEGPTSSTSATPKGSPGPRLTLEDVLNLYGVKALPEGDMSLEWIVKSTQEIVDRKGIDYVKENKIPLLNQLEYIQSM